MKEICVLDIKLSPFEKIIIGDNNVWIEEVNNEFRVHCKISNPLFLLYKYTVVEGTEMRSAGSLYHRMILSTNRIKIKDKSSTLTIERADGRYNLRITTTSTKVFKYFK